MRPLGVDGQGGPVAPPTAEIETGGGIRLAQSRLALANIPPMDHPVATPRNQGLPVRMKDQTLDARAMALEQVPYPARRELPNMKDGIGIGTDQQLPIGSESQRSDLGGVAVEQDDRF